MLKSKVKIIYFKYTRKELLNVKADIAIFIQKYLTNVYGQSQHQMYVDLIASDCFFFTKHDVIASLV